MFKNFIKLFTLICGFSFAMGAVSYAKTDLSLDMSSKGIRTTKGSGAHLRALDMLTGKTYDLEVKTGETIEFERLTIKLESCRYPVKNINGDAFSFLVVKDIREESPVFSGWMVASSPALSPLEHPRYDIWVLKCMAP